MDRKADILNSAERLARSRGFDGFSYADIEKDVGIRKASIHHHFPSKQDLALSLIQRYRENFADALQQIAAREDRAASRLTNYLDTYRHALSDGQTVCLCVAFSAGRDSLSTEVLAELNDYHADNIHWLKAVFHLGKEDGSISAITHPKDEATACLALVEGAHLIARAAEDTDRFEAALAGLRARTR